LSFEKVEMETYTYGRWPNLLYGDQEEQHPMGKNELVRNN
jgi:hypothetical protein